MQQFYKIFIIILSLITNLPIATISTNKNLSAKKTIGLFADHAQADYYWEAVLQMTHNNKQTALNIIKALQSNERLDSELLWKEKQPENIDSFFDQLFLTYVADDPQMLTQIGLLESIGIRDHNAHLTDVSPEAELKRFEEKKESLIVLKKYVFDELSHDQKLSHQIFLWMLEHRMAGEKFLFHEYKINQMDGVLAQLSILFTQFHKLEVAADVENYISRLKQIPWQLQQAIKLIELQKSRRVVPPRFTVQKVITIIEKSNPAKVREHSFYTHLAQKIEKIDVANKDIMLAQVETVLHNEVYPAYQNLKKYFLNLLESAQNNHGVWALPHGDEYYAHMLKFHTTTDLSADEIYALGLQEVSKVHQEMRAILAQEGIVDDQKEVGALVAELSKDPRFYYPCNDEGRKECLADYERILARIRKELVHLFDLKPQTGVKIEKVPAHEEEGAPMAYYFQPSIDGTRPGIFFANLRNMEEVPKYGMETLTIHEAEPGHHFQLALQNEMQMPILRKVGLDFTAFFEGWALYTEKLAYEENFYSSSFSKLGHLQDELLRAVRLVVDTGIHHRRWTREQAIEYMVKATGYHPSSVITEVERYFVLPGQACSYKIGQLKILELRNRAKDALGKKFDIRKFHNVVLKHGAVPLTLLEELVDQYIKDTLAK